MFAVWDPRLNSWIRWPADVSNILISVPWRNENQVRSKTSTLFFSLNVFELNHDLFVYDALGWTVVYTENLSDSNIVQKSQCLYHYSHIRFSLFLMPWLSACPGGWGQYNRALLRAQECPLEASLCWPGLLSAHVQSGCQEMLAKSCCCLDTEHTNLQR